MGRVAGAHVFRHAYSTFLLSYIDSSEAGPVVRQRSSRLRPATIKQGDSFAAPPGVKGF
jgi:hypothetical protein